MPVAAAQFEHSLVHREPQADLFPASLAPGGVVTWSPLGDGMLTGIILMITGTVLTPMMTSTTGLIICLGVRLPEVLEWRALPF